MSSIKTEGSRGRSPGPAAERPESNLSELSMEDRDSPASQMAHGASTRTSKRRKRSELSPSSKATHSIIEKERREAMNEKFSELAANIPELVEAIAAGKRPTKGEIVKASIARHQEQERRVRELMNEIQMLRSGGAPPSQFPLDGTPSLAATVPEPVAPNAQQLSMPYQIQASHPIGVPAAQDNLWVGHLLHKTNEPLTLCHDTQPLPLLPDMAQPVSPFKQTSMMNWTISSLPQPLDPATLTIGFPPSGLVKGFMDNSGTLEHLGRRNSVAAGTVSTSGFSSPTFTSSDSDSSFSTDALDSGLEERKFFADNLSFEPFAMASTNVEQTPLTSLLGLPSTEQTAAGAEKKARRAAAPARSSSRRARSDEAAGEAGAWNSPLAASMSAAS